MSEMNRRQFLLGASAVAVAASVPVPAVADVWKHKTALIVPDTAAFPKGAEYMEVFGNHKFTYFIAENGFYRIGPDGPAALTDGEE